MIVFVAPYSPAGRDGNAHLGAARKIETVLALLSEMDSDVILVNTAHSHRESPPLFESKLKLAGAQIREIFPPIYSSAKYGKLRNLFDVRKVADHIMQSCAPGLVWLYNGYAMESRLGLELKRRTNCVLIQEMEDWHFSRSRGINPKPYIDWFFWRSAARQAEHVFAVNAQLAERVRQLNSNVTLFPGIVAEEVSLIAAKHPPFGMQGAQVTIGYFGGLSAEKGAHHVLDMFHALPEEFRILVTGSGPLEGEFRNAASQFPEKLEFKGRVDERTLFSLIARCDVLLNPHSPIEKMGNGVFPFKVIESIASGRMLVSTELPDDGLGDVLGGVCFVEHDSSAMIRRVLDSKEWYSRHEDQVRAGADAATRRFGTETIAKTIRSLLDGRSR